MERGDGDGDGDTGGAADVQSLESVFATAGAGEACGGVSGTAVVSADSGAAGEERWKPDGDDFGGGRLAADCNGRIPKGLRVARVQLRRRCDGKEAGEGSPHCPAASPSRDAPSCSIE